jgi:hypothetical protein
MQKVQEALQVGAIMEALRRRRDRVNLSSPQKLRFPPPWNADVFSFF